MFAYLPEEVSLKIVKMAARKGGNNGKREENYQHFVVDVLCEVRVVRPIKAAPHRIHAVK